MQPRSGDTEARSKSVRHEAMKPRRNANQNTNEAQSVRVPPCLVFLLRVCAPSPQINSEPASAPPCLRASVVALEFVLNASAIRAILTCGETTMKFLQSSALIALLGAALLPAIPAQAVENNNPWPQW